MMMAKRQTLEEQIARLSSLEQAAVTPDAVQEVRGALGSPRNVLAARAARAAGRLGLKELIPDLAECFERFMAESGKDDKGCLAKKAVAEALAGLGFETGDVFLRGVRHVQFEPSFGPPVDSAAELRSACLCGLFGMGHPEAVFEAIQLIVDSEPGPRRTAAEALGAACGIEGEMLLRLKVLAGDKEPAVYGECFQGLMKLSPGRSIRFVAGFLDDRRSEVVTEAAFAIGSYGKSEGFRVLSQRYEASTSIDLRKTLLIPIASTRCEEAFDFLVALIRGTPSALASEAVRALALLDDHARRRSMVREAVDDRAAPEVTQAFRRAFEQE